MCIAVLTGSVVQAYAFLPKTANGGQWLFLLPLLPLLSGTDIGRAFSLPSRSPMAAASGPPSTTHPVVEIWKQANAVFQATLASQSKSIEEATAGYVRRYGREPPKGFDQWFEVAMSHDFQFIDEFDAIQRTVMPFWRVSLANLRVRIDHLRNAPKVLEVRVENGKLIPNIEPYRNDPTVSYYAGVIAEWIDATVWENIIPNMTFYMNLLDEPRIAVPRDTLELAMSKVHDIDGDELEKMPALRNSVKWIDLPRQSGHWQALMSSCPFDSPARQHAGVASSGRGHSKSLGDELLPFVTNMTVNKDVCASNNLLDGNAFLTSPANAKLSHTLVPVFSQCKTSVHNDILVPSIAYTMSEYSGNREEDDHDVPWSEKLPLLYWAGSSTGGWATTSNWRQSQRMRLTQMTSPPTSDTSPGSQQQPLVQLLQRHPTTSIWHQIYRAYSTVSHLFHLRITNIVQCEEGACAEMRAAFSPAPISTDDADSSPPQSIPEPESASNAYKYALDIDGNSFSARFYRLLRSNSCVLKHTAFDEWHDGRLVPWVHFIPVSSSAAELGELMRFLLEEKDGMKIGEAVARRGKEWAERTLREVDLQVGLVRALLEYARLVGDDREGRGRGWVGGFF